MISFRIISNYGKVLIPAFSSQLQLKLNMSFQILFNSFSELTNDQIVPPSQQSESTRKCGLNTTWTSRNGMSAGSSDLMDSIDKHHTKAISSLLHKSQTKFNLYIFDVQRSFWGQHGTWSRKRGFESDHELFHPPTQNFKKIRVVTVVESPFVEVDSDESGQLVFSGFCVDLLDEVSKQLNFQYIMYNASEYGRLDGHSWVGAVGEVAYKRADIAVSGMLITSQREEAVDFSTRFMDYGVGILIRKTTPSQTVFGFLQPLNPQVWTCVASTIFIAGGVMFLVTRISPNTRGRHYNRHGHSHGHGHSMQDRYVDPLSDYSQFTFRNSIWFTMTSIMQQGGDLHPKSGAARIMGCFWWFFTLIITATYTANLAAFLTVNRMETPIDSLQSLVAQNNVKYGTVRHSPIHLDFKNQSEMNALYERIANYLDHQHSNKDSILVDDAEEGYRRVREGGYAFMWDNPILQWMKRRGTGG
ncbi:glutamate receptor ionotropic, delta-2-like [Symsagittifera roscoffensis]|uniref:glutamate receptor ionotropic, delta-2-like n=1 Tax=Symsagittifera roscoffensis TaxID=84072 RepID=UPI00307C386C